MLPHPPNHNEWCVQFDFWKLTLENKALGNLIMAIIMGFKDMIAWWQTKSPKRVGTSVGWVIRNRNKPPPPHSYKDMMLKAHNHGSQT